MNKTLLMIVVAVSVLVLGAIGGGFFMMWSKISTLQAATVEDEPEVEEEAVEEKGIGALFPLDTFIVNLADDGGKRYLRVTMNLELNAPELEEDFKMRLPQIRDLILMVLPSKRFDDVRTVDGKMALRAEIMDRINGLLNAESVNNIYFTEFVVQ